MYEMYQFIIDAGFFWKYGFKFDLFVKLLVEQVTVKC